MFPVRTASFGGTVNSKDCDESFGCAVLDKSVALDISDDVLLQVVFSVAPTFTRSVYDLLDFFPLFAQSSSLSEIPSKVVLGSAKSDLQVRALGSFSKLLLLMPNETAALLCEFTSLLDFKQLILLYSLSQLTKM